MELWRHAPDAALHTAAGTGYLLEVTRVCTDPRRVQASSAYTVRVSGLSGLSGRKAWGWVLVARMPGNPKL